MPRRKKGAVRKGHGKMCNICGVNCGRGGALKRHVEGRIAAGGHEVSYADYNKCFYGVHVKNIIADGWDDSVVTARGLKVITHVLVRRFVGDAGPRGVARAARVKTYQCHR